MLVLGIAGSPRRGGNSEILLDEALSAAREAGADIEKVVLSTLRFSPCIACGACEQSGDCVLDDDVQVLYEKIGAADALIFASPVYFYGVSAWAKAVIDRAQALWSRKYVLRDSRYTREKKGFLIGVGATRGSRLFEGVLLTVKYFFDAAGFQPAGELLVRGVDKKGAVLEYEQHLEDARAIGREAARQ